MHNTKQPSPLNEGDLRLSEELEPPKWSDQRWWLIGAALALFVAGLLAGLLT